MERLIVMAEAMGLAIAYGNIGRLGGLIYSNGLVVLNQRESVRAQRVTLAHEMGHWTHGHDWTRGHDRERDEIEADTFAARTLITLKDYALAESAVGTHPGALAKELAVTRRLVELRRLDFARDLRILTNVERWRDEWAS